MEEILNLDNYTEAGFELLQIQLPLGRTTVTYRVYKTPTEDRDAVQHRTEPALRWLMQYSSRAAARTADELLPLKNENWLREGESEATKVDFLRKLNLFDVKVDLSGHLHLTYAAGDLFWGHEIVVGLTDEQDYEYFTLQG